MSLFSKIKKSNPVTNPSRHDLQKAMMLLGCAVAMADGEPDEKELDKMESVAARMPLFANNTVSEDTAVMHEAGLAYDENAAGAVGWATDVLQHETWTKTAVCFMCEIIMADGEIDQSEMDVVTNLCHDLKIEIAEAQPIFNTFQIYYQKYRG